MKNNLMSAVLLVFLLSGCSGVGPYLAKNENPPAIKYCNDLTGHIKGTKPFVLGGTCCCTPTQSLLDAYRADGFCLDMDLNALIALYSEKGIKTSLDHKWCNNLCKWGPHLVKGGKCMSTPTPGTKNYEEVVSGNFGTEPVKAK